jgi:uncharacterized protein YkwD
MNFKGLPFICSGDIKIIPVNNGTTFKVDKYMPLSDRDYTKGEHPPTCTCVDCVNKRLGIVKHQKHSKYSKEENKLKFTYSQKKQESVNEEMPLPKEHQIDKQSQPSPPTNLPPTPPPHIDKIKIQNWLIALLLIFSLSIIGLGISYFVVSFIPFWILFGFSIIYSVEKWFGYITRKHKIIGKLYRLLLNVSILSLFGLLIWSSTKLFSHQFVNSLLIGSLIFFAELILFIWMWRVVSKSSWRWPSMKLTLVSLIVIFLILAFAGVNPFSTYKDQALNGVSNYFAEKPNTTSNENSSKRIESAQTSSTIPIKTTPSLINKASDVVRNLWNTDTSDYAFKFNQYRQSQGFAALTFTDDLNRIAELRLAEIKLNFSHASQGQYNHNLAENIVEGVSSNQEALTCWQGSPGHNANMLDKEYKYTGYAAGGGHAVQVFSEWITINGIPQLPPGWYFTN